MQMRKGRCECAREDANAQRQIRANAGAMVVRETANGEPQAGNRKWGRVLMTTDGRIVKCRFGLVVRLIANECYMIHFPIYPSYRQPSLVLHPLQSKLLIYCLHRTAPQDSSATDIAGLSIWHGAI